MIYNKSVEASREIYPDSSLVYGSILDSNRFVCFCQVIMSVKVLKLDKNKEISIHSFRLIAMKGK